MIHVYTSLPHDLLAGRIQYPGNKWDGSKIGTSFIVALELELYTNVEGGRTWYGDSS